MLRELLDGVDPKKGTKLKTNLDFFKNELKGSNLDTVCKGLARLNVVSIILDSKSDEPQLVFASMNAASKDLSQVDLIRSHALMGLEAGKQIKLYEYCWRKMEESFQQKFGQDCIKHLSDFVGYFLTVKTKCEQKEELYEAFKSYRRNTGEDIEEILREMKKYSEFYEYIYLGIEKDPALNAALKELTGDEGLGAKESYPLLLKLYDQCYRENLGKVDFTHIVRLIISYAFRRAICGMTPAKSKIFMDFLKHFYDEVSFDSFEAHLATLKDASRTNGDRFPDDDEFFDLLQSKEIHSSKYGTKQYCEYLLIKLENYLRKSSKNKEGEVNPDNYKVECIVSQNAGIPEGCQHTLGNLTLTGNNPKLGNEPHTGGGFAESPLLIAREITGWDKWNEAKIKDRAKRLAKEALNIWASPS